MKSITVQAPAKLNLTLSITGRRDDGYHLLDSLFVFCGLHDVITVTAGDGLTLVQPKGGFANEIGLSENNLVMKAARLLQKEAGTEVGARITLQKNIPVAAGLGGGSADAAATLNALNKLWGLHWPYERLEKLAAQLGADIPACVQSKPVIARGIGEELLPAPDMPEFGLLLVNPLQPAPTPEVFRAFKAVNQAIAPKQITAFPGAFPDLPSLVETIKPRGNDLLDAAVSVQPAINDVLAALHGTKEVRYAALSGSGATCFALYDDAKEAKIAAIQISERYPSWWYWVGC